MSQEENDLNRLIRVGEDSSLTNKKLIEAVGRVVKSIVFAVPPELRTKTWPNKLLPMNYAVVLLNNDRCELRRMDSTAPSSMYEFFEKGCITLELARLFARDVANGFLTQLCKTIEAYRNEVRKELEAVEEGGALLDSAK